MKELVLDISHVDADIDLAAWKARHDIYGVIIKAGGYENLGNGHPERFETRIYKTHLANARALGIHVGAYFYDVCTAVATAKANADYFSSLLGKYGADFSLPAYMDVEDPRQLNMGRRALTDVIEAFCDRMREHGYLCGVYTGRCALTESMCGEELAERYPLWIAEYSDACHTPIEHGMWQFGAMHINGDVYWGDRAGYRDANWLYVDYPSVIKNGENMSGKLSYAEAAAEVMRHFVDHDAHGYSQLHRDGNSEVETITLSDGTQVSFQGGDRDCSRLVQTCYVVVGALPRGMHVWTGNQREVLLSNGFVEVSLDSLQRGDMLWRTGHTELYMGNGIEAGARRSETYGIDGRTGDQDGGEITRSAFVRSHWTSAYRCVKKRPGEGDATPAPAEGSLPQEDATTEEAEMMRPVFVRLDGDPTEHLFVPAAGTLHAISNQDEKRAVIDLYARAGVNLDPTCRDLGAADAPWGARANDVLMRGPAFAGWDRFNRHPSVQETVRDVVRQELRNSPKASVDAAGTPGASGGHDGVART